MSVPFSKASGREERGNAAGSKDAAKAALMSSMRTLQEQLAALHALAALDARSLDATSLARTESLLFDSRAVARSMGASLKSMEAAAASEASHERTQAAAAAALAQSHAQAQATRQVLAALQSAIEKAATLLLARHRQRQEDARIEAATGRNGSSVGDKRKQGSAVESNVASNKRVRGGIIAPPPTRASAQDNATASAPAVDIDSRVEQALTQVRSLQVLQEHLQRNADAMSPALSAHSSGSSTPSRRSTQLRSAHTQPHHALTTAPLHQLLQEHHGAAEAKYDDGPQSARSDDSMTSEADSESAVLQRQHMLAQLADNVRTLQARIAAEKARSAAPEPSHAMDSGTPDDDPGLDDSTAGRSSFVAPASVPRLDLAALTSQLGALEALLQRSIDTMAQLAALQERDMAKRTMKKQIRLKGGTLHADAASPFQAGHASSFAAKPFGEAAVPAPATLQQSTYTDAARAQQAMADAVAKLSDVPRAQTTVFGSAPRFPDASSKKLSKVQQRKQLYDKYAAIQADLKRALLQAEGGGELNAAFDATKPRLVQNVVMQPDPALAAASKPRSAQALIIELEREKQAERAKALGPGAYAAESALTQRRVQGVPSWGAGPTPAAAVTASGAAVDADGEPLAQTERFSVRPVASGALGPGAHVVKEDLVTRRVTGPRMVAPASPSDETVQAARARALAAPALAKRDELEMQKDYDQLDATVRRKVPALGALMQAPKEDEPSAHQRRAEAVACERVKQLQSEFEVREAKLEELAQTRRITQMRMLTSRRAAFLEAEEEKLARTARLLADGPPPADITPNYDYLRPHKPVFRYSAPKTQLDLADETTRFGQSARKRSTIQLARHAKHIQEAEEKLARIEEKQHQIRALRSGQSVHNMDKMQGRPNPQSTDTRDYDVAPAKDFVQLKHTRGDNWSRSAARAISEDSVDPEIDDVIGGCEGDVLDLEPKDALTKRRAPSHAFGPKGGPAVALAMGLQTLSDTELDYANGAGDEYGGPSVLYPNLDFGRKRQGRGGAIPLNKQVLGGSRSDGDDENEDEEFPYLAEGNMRLDVKYGAIEPAVKMGKFAVRRAEFLKLHALAKEREAARMEAESNKLVLNAHMSSDYVRGHKPAPSMAFSARHDTGTTADDEIDDAEALGDFLHAQPARQRGGPGAYEPKYSFKDPHLPGAQFGKGTGRPALDSSDDEIEGRADNRDFIGGINAAKSDPSRPVVASALPGTNFSRAKGRIDQAAEDKADFPDTHAEGDRLDLNPRLSQSSSMRTGVNMARTTGRPEGPDALDLEAQEGSRLDLHPNKARKRVAGVSFAKGTGRDDGQDALDIESDQPRGPDLQPNFDLGAPRVPGAAFADAERFGLEPGVDPNQAQSDLNPVDTAVRKRSTRAAVLGTEDARIPHATSSTLESEQNMALMNMDKPSMHVPSVNFALAGPRMQPLKPLGAQTQLVLQPELGTDFVASDVPSHGFGTASRLPKSAASSTPGPQLALQPGLSSTSGASGPSFGSELRPGQGLTFGKVEGSVLHPEIGEEFLRKSHPAWSFVQAKRFGSELEQALNAPDVQTALHPQHQALEPKSPHAFFPPHDRFSGSPSAAGANPDEQLLALLPSDASIRARHPQAFLGSEARFSGAVNELDVRKQLNLNPNIDAVRPNTPSATLELSSRRHLARDVDGLPAEPPVGHRLKLDPKPAYPASPAAHITSSARGNDKARASYYNSGIALYPDHDTQHPRAPAHTMLERPFDAATYVPTNAEMQAARKLRQQQEARAAAAAHADEEDALTLDDSTEDLSARSTRGSRPSRGSSVLPDADADVSELEHSAAALSLDGSASDSFSLPSAGVVGHTASLVRARREQQTREAAREQRRVEREEQARALARGRISALILPGSGSSVGDAAAAARAANASVARPPSPPAALFNAVLPQTRSVPSNEPHTQPTATTSATASSVPAAPAPVSPRSSVSASAPVPRRTVQFAEHDEVKEFERPLPEGVRPAPTAQRRKPPTRVQPPTRAV